MATCASLSSCLDKVAGCLTNVFDSRSVDSLEGQVDRTSSLTVWMQGLAMKPGP